MKIYKDIRNIIHIPGYECKYQLSCFYADAFFEVSKTKRLVMQYRLL